MINIFARPSFIGNRFHRWSDKLQTQRVSSRVRGEEIATFLGDKCKLNPELVDIQKGDVNVYVKPESLDIVGQGDWLDFLDGGHFEDELISRPDIKVIASSSNSFEVLKNRFKNLITLIPHHHINFERRRRIRGGITTCGYIGSYSPHSEKFFIDMGKEIEKIGMKFYPYFEYKTREDAINFYLSIDILIVGDWHIDDINPHKVPTKIINAASFGVPSVAFPRNGYKEIEGKYLRANNMDELISHVSHIKEKGLSTYNKLSEDLVKWSEDYHIENSAKLYLELQK